MSSKKNQKDEGKTTSQQTSEGQSSAEGLSNPSVVINGQYLKDSSFENPGSYKSFQATDKAPEFNVNLEINAQKIGEASYEVVLSSRVDAKRGDEVLYIAEVNYAGIFSIQNVPDKFLHPFLMIQCPNYLFPSLRTILGQLTTDGGFQPFLLQPVDFASLYQQKLQEMEKRESKTQSK